MKSSKNSFTKHSIETMHRPFSWYYLQMAFELRENGKIIIQWSYKNCCLFSFFSIFLLLIFHSTEQNRFSFFFLISVIAIIVIWLICHDRFQAKKNSLYSSCVMENIQQTITLYCQTFSFSNIAPKQNLFYFPGDYQSLSIFLYLLLLL